MLNNQTSAILKQINEKKSSNVHFGTTNEAEQTITDFDHHPYTRFYRGVYYSSDPVVIEREAGWRPERKRCYAPACCEKSKPPRSCFEAPCSTVYPCSQRNSMEVPMCLLGYR